MGDTYVDLLSCSMEGVKVDKRIDDMLHKADNLPCLQHEKDMGKFDESLRMLNETNREIKDIIKRLPCDKHLSMIEKHEVRIEKRKRIYWEQTSGWTTFLLLCPWECLSLRGREARTN